MGLQVIIMNLQGIKSSAEAAILFTLSLHLYQGDQEDIEDGVALGYIQGADIPYMRTKRRKCHQLLIRYIL